MCTISCGNIGINLVLLLVYQVAGCVLSHVET